ncbi:UNVERIFIED_CONTAM: hypothetical protein FKN15_022614 [Acipenser sinensis]
MALALLQVQEAGPVSPPHATAPGQGPVSSEQTPAGLAFVLHWPVRVFINQIMHPAVEKDMGNPDLQAIRIASMNPILDPWVYILLRRAVFHRVMGLAKRAFRRRGNSVVPGSRQAVLYLAADKVLVTMLQAQGPDCPGEESPALSRENQCFGLRDSEETAERRRQTV